jgi:hypothetical protein
MQPPHSWHWRAPSALIGADFFCLKECSSNYFYFSKKLAAAINSKCIPWRQTPMVYKSETQEPLCVPFSTLSPDEHTASSGWPK